MIAASSVYETEPQAGAVDQDDFLNACLAIETELEPDELLAACKAVERRLGRVRGGARHAARPIDVDVLLLDELDYLSERLVLPHPEVSTRRFVLEPLLELDPELRLPSGAALADARERVRDQRVTRLEDPLGRPAKPPGRE